MRISVAVSALLFLGLDSVALGAELPAVYPWCGKTTGPLNVRNGIASTIVGALPKGQTVWVSRSAGQGWLEIEDYLDKPDQWPFDSHFVSEENVVPHRLPDSESVIRKKMFLVLHRNTMLDGTLYSEGTAFDYMGEISGAWRVRGNDGVIEYNDEAENSSGPLFYELPVWWDYANQRPVVSAASTRERPLPGYYTTVTLRMTEPSFSIPVFILLSVLFILAAIGANMWPLGCGFFLLALPLMVGEWEGEQYAKYLHRFDVAACYLASHQTEEGHITPVPASWIVPGHEEGITDRKLGNFLWGPLFVVLHLAPFALVPFAWRGVVLLVGAVHYLLVRHPAEKHVSVLSPAGQLTRRVAGALRERKRRSGRWVPTFVLENFERRLRAKKQLLRAERELLDEALEIDRKKAESRRVTEE